MGNFKELKVWQESVGFVTEIYRITKGFPQSECFGLISQIRRAAVSVPSNIAEGAARNSNKDFARFLQFSLGSISEIETQLIIAQKLNYLPDIQEITRQITSIRIKLVGLIKALKR